MDDFQKRMIEKSNEVDKRFHDLNLLHKQIEYQKDLQNKEFFHQEILQSQLNQILSENNARIEKQFAEFNRKIEIIEQDNKADNKKQHIVNIVNVSISLLSFLLAMVSFILSLVK
jgi:hypothetical protein